MRELAYALRKPLLILALSIATLAAAIASCHGQDRNHVVRIRVAEGGGAFSCGSGTLIGKTEAGHGVILTCWHLFRDSDGPNYIHFPNGEVRGGRLLSKTQADDLAVLIILDPPSEGTPLSESAMPNGSTATIAGYGGQGQYLAQRGAVRSSACFNGRTNEARVVTVQARQGDSGGPIYDGEGKVCGVISCAGPGETLGTCGPQVWRFVQQCGPWGCPQPMIRMRPRPTAPIPRLIQPQRPKPIEGNSAGPVQPPSDAPVPDVNPNRPQGPIARSDDIQTIKAAIVELQASVEAGRCKCDKDQPPASPDKACQCGPHKDCTCDPDKIAAAVMAKIKLPQPEKPKQPVKYVTIVADQKAAGWKRLNDEIERAKQTYHGIRVAPLPDFPIGVVPQAVIYQDGVPQRVVKGQHDVEELLSALRRGDLNRL